jgi:hypothetical protein
MHFQPVETGSAESHLEEGHVTSIEMAQPVTHNDPLDDVFGADSPGEHGQDQDFSMSDHPSDMRRLETEHHTAGYREGLTVAKASSVQAGFDEGFSLGASLGQAAGEILGVLEGIHEALRGTTSEAAASVEATLTEAREDLNLERLFASEHWAPDGNWKYDVKAREGSGDGEVLFDDVAAQHPLIKRWIAEVETLVETWKIDRKILEDDDEPRLDSSAPDTAVAPVATTTTAAPKQALDW